MEGRRMRPESRRESDGEASRARSTVYDSMIEELFILHSYIA